MFPSRRTLVLAALLLVAPSSAQEGAVPPKLQAALFKKIFAYDASLQAPGAARVLVVHPPSGAAQAQELVSAFAEVGISASAAEERSAAGQVRSATVIYVMAGASSPEALGHAANRPLTISGSPGLAENGEVSVGLGKSSAGRPEIIVHRGRLKAEGHELSASLLRLARVIQ